MTLQTDFSQASAMSPTAPAPAVRDIHAEDVVAALRAGWRDFTASPSHWIFLGVIYPVVGVILAFATSGANMLPLVFPMIAGFALVGPFAALGVYEISRRREKGLDPSWGDALEALRSPAIGSIGLLGGLLFAIFLAWLATAWIIYALTEGGYQAASASDFLRHILTTPSGLALIVVGNAVGFLFAAATLAIAAVSFPLLLDRPQTDAGTAIRTSVAAARLNPKSMMVWGLIVAALLALGSIPFFVGLAVVVPLLGHATWHLYRRVVV